MYEELAIHPDEEFLVAMTGSCLDRVAVLERTADALRGLILWIESVPKDAAAQKDYDYAVRTLKMLGHNKMNVRFVPIETGHDRRWGEQRERHRLAYRFRLDELTYGQIGGRLGVGANRARIMVRKHTRRHGLDFPVARTMAERYRAQERLS